MEGGWGGGGEGGEGGGLGTPRNPRTLKPRYGGGQGLENAFTEELLARACVLLRRREL